MHSTTAFVWIRTHRRTLTILLAVALAFTILATLLAPGLPGFASRDTSTDIAAADDGGMSVAGLSWSRMAVPGDPGGGTDTLGLSWS